MADYYPLIARAVAGLDKSTGETRRTLYERARAALLAQLRGVTPALSESDVTRERLALEEAIRKVETEAARRTRVDTPRPETAAPPPQTPAGGGEQKPAIDFGLPNARGKNEPPRPQSPRIEPTFSAPGKGAPQPAPGKGAPPPAAGTRAPAEKRGPDTAAPGAPRRPAGQPADPTARVDQALKDFRNAAPPKNAAEPGRGSQAREAGAPIPAIDLDRLEPRWGAEDFSSPRELPPGRSAEPRDGGRPAGRNRRPLPDEFEHPVRQPRLGPRFGGLSRLLIIGGIFVVGAMLATLAYQQRASLANLYQSLRGPAAPATRDAAQTRPKIADRVGGSQQDSSGRSAPGAQVAQRVVLTEGQPNSTERKQYVGSVIWRSEMVTSGPGLPPDLAIKADVEIPERKMRMNLVLRRNTEQSLPASHTIEILFATPPDFPGGAVADARGVLMEQADQKSTVPLSGLRVKVTNGFFLIGLLNEDNEVRRNVQLLKDRPLLSIPIIYSNNQHALLSLEKGVPGDRVFAEAFTAWKQ